MSEETVYESEKSGAEAESALCSGGPPAGWVAARRCRSTSHRPSRSRPHRRQSWKSRSSANARRSASKSRWSGPRRRAVDTDADTSKATFQVYEDGAGEYRWRLRHDNGEIISDCGQGYASKQKAKQGMRSVKTNAAGAAVEEEE